MEHLGTLLLFTSILTLSESVCNVNPSASARLENNGYSINIAIQSSIPEDETIIQKIEEYFTNTSAFMFKALKNRAYIKKVTVIVPERWTNTTTTRPTTGDEIYATADFQIGLDDSKNGFLPYLDQVGKCGEPNDKPIYVPVNYFLGDETCVWSYGPPEKKLTVTYAKYRFGIFDEHPGDSYNHAIRPRGEYVQNTCGGAIDGVFVKRDDPSVECTVLDLNQLDVEARTCVFQPDLDSDSTKHSLLYSDNIQGVESFCDQLDPGQHNANAENLHNDRCKGKSAWEVIECSPDFQNGLNTATDASLDTTPIFEYVKNGRKNIAMVMDTSGSMRGQKIVNLIVAATKFIADDIEDGSSVSLIDFDSDAIVLKSLTTLNEKADRDEVITAIPPVGSVGDSTCIGCGLQTGVTSLEEGGLSAAGNRILVITDGHETSGPYIHEVTDSIKAARVTVDSVIFAVAGSHPLDDLSKETGGITCFCPLSEQVDACLHGCFAKTVTKRSDNEADIAQTIKIELIPGGSGTTSYSFTLDKTIGRDTTLEITFPSLNNEQLYLTTPSGDVILEGDDNYVRNDDLKTIKVTIPGIAEPGVYTFFLLNKGFTLNQNAQGVVKSKSVSADQDPITLKSSHKVIGNIEYSGIQFSAEVRKGPDPVVGAKVTAIINTASGTVVLPLYDDGIGYDLVANDGSHTNALFDIGSAGKYTYSVKVASDVGGVQVISKRKDTTCTTTRRKKRSTNPDSTTTIENIPSFERENPGNYFETDQPINGGQSEFIPPSKINDLKIIDSRATGTRLYLTLQWTAVGEDMVNGYATSYKMCYAQEKADLLKYWENCRLVRRVISGNFSSPQEARTTETFQIKLYVNTDGEGVWAIAVTAFDAFGNEGEISNVVVSNLKIPPPTTTPPSTTSTSTTTTSTTSTTPPTTTTTTEKPTTTTSTTTPSTTDIETTEPKMTEKDTTTTSTTGKVIPYTRSAKEVKEIEEAKFSMPQLLGIVFGCVIGSAIILIGLGYCWCKTSSPPWRQAPPMKRSYVQPVSHFGRPRVILQPRYGHPGRLMHKI